jgi:hypothetical protein
MMVVVANSIFEARRRTGRLDAPDQSFRREHAQGVVHRLQGDGANLTAHELGHRIGRDVRLSGDSPQDGQPLSSHLDAASTKKIGRIVGHVLSDYIKFWNDSKIAASKLTPGYRSSYVR